MAHNESGQHPFDENPENDRTPGSLADERARLHPDPELELEEQIAREVRMLTTIAITEGIDARLAAEQEDPAGVVEGQIVLERLAPYVARGADPKSNSVRHYRELRGYDTPTYRRDIWRDGEYGFRTMLSIRGMPQPHPMEELGELEGGRLSPRLSVANVDCRMGNYRGRKAAWSKDYLLDRQGNSWMVHKAELIGGPTVDLNADELSDPLLLSSAGGVATIRLATVPEITRMLETVKTLHEAEVEYWKQRRAEPA